MRYLAPGRFTRLVANPLVAALTRAGLSMKGSRVLAVRGRTTGEVRTTPVNPLTLDGHRYLVAPRGQTQWVRNLRAHPEGELRLGRRTERFTATEVADADKGPILEAYKTEWKTEVGRFFGEGEIDPADFPVFECYAMA